jgi:hypothetical protein
MGLSGFRRVPPIPGVGVLRRTVDVEALGGAARVLRSRRGEERLGVHPERDLQRRSVEASKLPKLSRRPYSPTATAARSMGNEPDGGLDAEPAVSRQARFG